MKASTLKALKQSIAHWKRMADGKAKVGETPYGEYCALCIRFATPADAYDCTGCPVKEKTGESGCKLTPYEATYDAYHAEGMFSNTFLKAAKKELAFLQSIIPKTTKRKTAKP